MANTRHDHAEGKSSKRQRGSQAQLRARERIAAERAARKRAELRRRILALVASVTAVLAIVGVLAAVKLNSANPTASESLAPSGVIRQVTTIPSGVVTGVSPGQATTPLQAVRKPGAPLTIGGKLGVIFVSEESCPFCAAERWPLAVALSHFGILSGLGATRSSATDIYPDTATLSFRTAHYRSAELTLRTTELTDNTGHLLQAQTPLDAQLINTYDVPPTSTAPTSQAPSRSSTSEISTSWPVHNTTRRYWPACPPPRSPASCATHRARSPRRSTGPPQSSSRPSATSCTTRRPGTSPRAPGWGITA